MTTPEAHPFLSDEWMEAARAVRARHADRAPEIEADLRINIVVFDVPFRDGELRAYLDTSSGTTELELGELDEADVTVTTDYATAQAIFVDQDPAVAMQSFMAGKVKVQGDMMKLMALQATITPDDDAAQEVADEIAAITERPPAPEDDAADETEDIDETDD
ncbi:MAG: SCP2 sterol-binding domain-containing protein [Actinomycetota bacterium]